VPWLAQACRVPFWTTASPARTTVCSPSSSSSVISPDTTRAWERAAARARVAYAAIVGLMHLAQTDPDGPPPDVLADEAAAVFLAP
jgi:hypothetical protein